MSDERHLDYGAAYLQELAHDLVAHVDPEMMNRVLAAPNPPTLSIHRLSIIGSLTEDGLPAQVYTVRASPLLSLRCVLRALTLSFSLSSSPVPLVPL